MSFNDKLSSYISFKRTTSRNWMESDNWYASCFGTLLSNQWWNGMGNDTNGIASIKEKGRAIQTRIR